MDDLISRQAAIDALHMHLMYRMGTDSNKKRLDDWINGLPSAQETHEERTETHACDLIGRQAAKEAVRMVFKDLQTRTEINILINDLPSAHERKRGKWTKENACEFCGFQPWFERDIHTLSFCPNCGADMREGHDAVN